MLTLAAFVVAIGVLITVHEWGHYRMAVLAGVKVRRFAIGFGPALLSWRRGADATEFVIGAIPLGGYVRMVDERDGDVAADELPRAFGRRPLGWRAAIVAAGPAANLILAVLLFAVVAWAGGLVPRAVLGTPTPGSAAAVAGLRGGDEVRAVVAAGQRTAIESWPQLQQVLEDDAGGRVELDLDGGRRATLDLTGARPGDLVARRSGLTLQLPPPRILAIEPGSAAAAAGLQIGDVVLGVGGASLDPAAMVAAIRASRGAAVTLRVARAGRTLDATVVPRAERVGGGAASWRIGATLDAQPAMIMVRHGPLQALGDGVARTWEISSLTLCMLGRMVVGRASLSNLGGPLTIADAAGRSAALGWRAYLEFLALVSVSLGVLNLLPLPVLDGGHLLYHAFEALTRRSVPQRVQNWLQQGGLVVIMLMMAIALYNDVARLLGPLH